MSQELMRIWWYLGFVKDGEFTHGCVVQAWTLEKAIQRSWKLRINPGGDVVGLPLSFEHENDVPHNQLLTMAELGQYGEVCSYKQMMSLLLDDEFAAEAEDVKIILGPDWTLLPAK
jgi:hypothetical protein